MTSLKLTGTIALALTILPLRAASAQGGGAPPAGAIDYDRDIKPILSEKCFSCHGPRQQLSGLRLDLRQNALRGGDYGVVIVPGKAAESKLIQRLTGSAVGIQMPPTGPLDPQQIATLRAWIDQGAEMPGRASDAVLVERVTEPKVQQLVDAIHRHDMAVVRDALAHDRSLVNAADADGASPLMHAAYAGTIEMMRLLIDAGADVNATNARRATPLHWAATDPAKMKLLLSKGAKIDAKTIEGRTALHVVAMQPEGAPLAKLLIEGGADVNVRTLTGLTPLFNAVAASLETTELLLAAGADPNAQAQTGLTPIMSPCLPGAASILVRRGADVNLRGKKGETAIANLASIGDLAGVKLLLSKNVDINVPDHRGYTALMLAAHFDRDLPEIISLLLAHGADPSATGENETALTLAAKRGETDVTRMLRSARPNDAKLAVTTTHKP
jgi:ankyrin repeat protein